jgi:hypothetical protein
VVQDVDKWIATVPIPLKRGTLEVFIRRRPDNLPPKKPQHRTLLKWGQMGPICPVLVAAWLQKNLAVNLELIDMGLGVAQWIW